MVGGLLDLAQRMAGDEDRAVNTVSMLGRAYSLLGFRIVDGVGGVRFPQVAVTGAVTETAGYDPHIVIGNADGEAKAGPATLKLTGWRPGVAVQMTMVDENDKTVFTGSAVPDKHGAATVHTPSLKVGHYDLSATDGLWKFSGDEGAYNDVYGGLDVS